MPRPKGSKNKDKIEVHESFEELKSEKPKNLLTAIQAWQTIGGNSRLMTFVTKKYTGTKELEEWRGIFENDMLK